MSLRESNYSEFF